MRPAIERDYIPAPTAALTSEPQYQAQLRRRGLCPSRQHRVAQDEAAWLFSFFHKAKIFHFSPWSI